MAETLLQRGNIHIMSTTGGGRTGSQSIERALAVLRCLAAATTTSG